MGRTTVALSTTAPRAEELNQTVARRILFALPVLIALVAGGIYAATTLGGNGDGSPPVPRTEDFPATLGETGIFQGESLAALEPADGYHLVELTSALFSDGSKKQRLLHVPAGTTIQPAGSGLPEFPEGTMMVKTFYYNYDDRDPSLGRRVVETRLLTLEQGLWNVATYVWNDEQTEANIQRNGGTLTAEWTDALGRSRTANYEVPTERQCVSCHQNSDELSPLGPELRNLNRTVIRDQTEVNQLDHLQAVGTLGAVDSSAVDTIVDYLDASLPISDRGRAYLDMNCSHCHQPNAWSRPADEGFDFRWEVPGAQTGIFGDEDEILEQFLSGEMPFLGTTFVDEDGRAILSDYLETTDALGG